MVGIAATKRKERNMDKKITSSAKKKTKKMEPVKCAKCGLEYSESALSTDHQNAAFYE